VATAIPSPPPALATGAPELRLSANTLVAIFRGQITNWNDERIRADNPGLQLPDLPIRVVYRSDASGTTRAVTEYLVAVNQEWRDSIGAAYRLGDAGSQPWPVGEGTNGSSGVTRFVQNTPGAIGYVATAFAAEAGLPLATLQNAAGNWVSPDSSTIREAANNTVNALDERLRGFSVNAPGANAYPISIYTWAISCPAGLSLEQAQALSDFLYWAITDPQAIAEARNLGYEPVPASVQQRVLAQLEAIEINGTRAFAAPTSGQFQPRSFSPLVAISGAGSTLAGPLYQALSQRYAQVQPSVQLNYTPQGSTAGQEGLLQQGSIQFAGTEEAVVDNDVQITRAACQPAPLHVPVAVGAVGIVYNVPRP
jgi:phosphate ABC transporter phosphate-binding protein